MIYTPDLTPGTKVFAYVGRWRASVILRVIWRDPKLARHGKPRGSVAVVQFTTADGVVRTARRPLAELVPDWREPGGVSRASAQDEAARWWATRRVTEPA